MKKIVIILFLIWPFSSHAGTYQGALTIDRLWIGSKNIIFGFTTKPADCIDSEGYHRAHAFIEVTSNPLYKEQLSLLLTAKATGKTIDIWYTDLGDCKTRVDLLKVNTVGFTKGQ